MGGGGGSTIGMVIGAVAGIALIYITGGAASPFVAGWMGVSTTAGAVLYGAAIGATVGGLAGGLIAPASFNGPEVQGPRIAELQIMGVAEGAGVHLAFGHTMRLAGQLIYAGGLLEESHASSNPTSSGKSFTAGTPICMGDGTCKAIEQIKVGDEVSSVRFRWLRRPKWENRRVVKVHKGEASRFVTFKANNRTTECTPEHEVYGYKPNHIKPKWHWFQARSLVPGDFLITEDGPAQVEDVNAQDITKGTHNFEVARNRNYLANGCLVHNGGGGSGGGGSTTWYTYSTDMAVAYCEGPVEEISRLIINGKNIYKAARVYSVTAPLECSNLQITLTATLVQQSNRTGFDQFSYAATITFNGGSPGADLSKWRSGYSVTTTGFDNASNNRTAVSSLVDEDNNKVTFPVDGTSSFNYGTGTYTHSYDGMTEVTDTSAVMATTTIPYTSDVATRITNYRGDSGTGGDSTTMYQNDVADAIMTVDRDAPAYRGISYTAFEGLELANFGNQIPQVHAVVDCRHADTMATTWGGVAVSNMQCADVVDRVLIRAGRAKANGIGGTYTAGDDFTTDAMRDYDMTVKGYASMGAKPSMSILANMILAYDLVVQEDGGVLRFLKRGTESTGSILETDLSASEGDATDPPPKFAISDQPDTGLPSEINIDYFDVNDNYQRGSQKARRSVTNQLARVDKIDIPVGFTASEAQEIANRVLYQTWQQRTVCQFSLGPKYITINENDILSIPVDGQLHKVRVLEVNRGANFVHEIKGLLTESETTTYDGSGDDGTVDEGEPYIPPMMRVFLMDIPPLRNQDVLVPGLYIGANTIDIDAEFAGATIWNAYSTIFEMIGHIPNEVFSFTVTNTIATGVANEWDDTSTITITMDGPDATSFPIDAPGGEFDVLNGTNMVLIGGEIIGFEQVDDGVVDGTFILSNLIRGRRDTIDAMSIHESGQKGIMLSHNNGAGLFPVVYDESNLFIPQNYKVVSNGQEVTDAIPITDQGNSTRCRPFRPCNVRGTRSGNGDWIIQFCRTDRKVFRTFSQAPTPMSDTDEVYVMEILDPDDDTVVQTLSMTASGNGSVIELAQHDGGGNTTRFPQATFKRADQELYGDWNASPPDSIKVNIWQVGDIIVKGNVRTETLTFASHY